MSEHARVLLSATANLHVEEGEKDKLLAITTPDFSIVVGYFVPESEYQEWQNSKESQLLKTKSFKVLPLDEYQEMKSKTEKWDAYKKALNESRKSRGG